MSSPEAMAEAQEQALGLFADAVLKLALDIQRQALDAEDLDQKVRAAGAVHQLGRSLRQTIALQAKLARADAAKAGRDPQPAAPADPAPADPTAVAVRRRRDWLTRGVERCVWNEYERDDETAEFTGESLLEDLHERLADLMADREAFLELDPDDLLVRQLCKRPGLNAPRVPPARAGRSAGPGAGRGQRNGCHDRKPSTCSRHTT